MIQALKNKKDVKKGVFELLYSSVLELAKIFKFSFIVGSKFGFFSLSQAIAPLSGMFGAHANFMVFVLRTLITILFGSFSFLFSFLYHLPTFFAGLYFSSNSKTIKVLIPLVCMIIFISHPVGNQAFVYSLYWLIPIALTFFKKESVFVKSLGSTFTAHAVGSVLWLYTHNLDSLTWNLLTGIVWIERLAFALTMTGAYYLIVFIKDRISQNLFISKSISIFIPSRLLSSKLYLQN